MNVKLFWHNAPVSNWPFRWKVTLAILNLLQAVPMGSGVTLAIYTRFASSLINCVMMMGMVISFCSMILRSKGNWPIALWFFAGNVIYSSLHRHALTSRWGEELPMFSQEYQTELRSPTQSWARGMANPAGNKPGTGNGGATPSEPCHEKLRLPTAASRLGELFWWHCTGGMGRWVGTMKVFLRLSAAAKYPNTGLRTGNMLWATPGTSAAVRLGHNHTGAK